jgi:hypothetical protein
VPAKPTRKPEGASISARIAAANAKLADLAEPGPRFPGEDAGRSLAEMAERDLDAALQLLVDRAQYITGATGAAIALRRGEHNDMLCRATAGSNAPELGALLSMEYGLSGESVRTRQVLRCDDAERDPRVNREVCRELGIASVVVMPIMRDKQVLGVFELLSGKTKAFEERDLAALLRLSQMVETAVSHAVGAQVVPVDAPLLAKPTQPQPVVEKPKSDTPRSADLKDRPMAMAASATGPAASVAPVQVPSPKTEEAPASPKKPLFWSAAMRAQADVQAKPSADTAAVPPTLRNLKKCQACGFPVSQGRTYCVECEEKQWRGQPASKVTAPKTIAPKAAVPEPQPSASIDKDEMILLEETVKSSATFTAKFESKIESSQAAAIAPTALVDNPAPQIATSSEDIQTSPSTTPDNSAPFLSASLQSESWLASNKYVIGALLLVSGVIGAIAWLH